jgi:hypothetical protein
LTTLALAAGVIGSGGCHDGGTGPVPLAVPGPAFAASSAALSALGPGWRTRADAPHGCFVSAATGGGPIPYRYDRVPMSFPAGALAKDGAVAAFRYRLQGPDGTVYRVLNCVIPNTKQARHHVGKFFDVPTEQPDGTLTAQGCVIEGMCPVDEIIVIGTPKKREPTGGTECTIQDYCWTEPYPIPDPGTPGGGGSTPCATCGPAVAMLTCSPRAPVRGEPVQCVVSMEDGSFPSVGGWSFQSPVGTVPGPSGGAEWSGPIVQDGMVTATMSGNTLLFKVGVDTRGWRWSEEQWRLSSGTAPIPSDGNGVQEWVVDWDVRLGWNCARTGCGTLRRVEPDIRTNDQNGYTAAQVQAGPNTGYWYVSDRTFHMDRATNLNPTIKPTAHRYLLAEPQARQCRQAMNLPSGTPVYVNQYEFNEVCMGVDMDAALRGLWNHEEWGSGTGNGHEAHAYMIARQMQYDPWHAVESLVFRDEIRLRQRAVEVVDPIQTYIYEEARGHAYAKGNWSGDLWLWQPSLNQFTYAKIPPGQI